MDEGRVLASRYRLDTVVGRGGMGTVWRARDLTLHREVAVKEVVLPPGLSDGERDVLYERTLREARASARLSHPAVVVVHDVVEEDMRPWIVMELVLAPSLQDVLDRDGVLPHRRVAEIGVQMLGALRHAHSKGILHRDVKPSNVLLCDSGRVVLTDFGIAQMEGDATLTQTGLVMGSPAYIPPERAQGARAVPASDLWSLGATLYAALEGRSPYERSDAMSSLQAALLEPVPPPRNGGPLRPVLDGLLARQPMHRMNAEQAEPLLARVAKTAAPAPASAPQSAAGVTMGDEPRTVLDGPSETVTDPADLGRPVQEQRLDPPSVRRDPPSVRRDPSTVGRGSSVPQARRSADVPATSPDRESALTGETIDQEPYAHTPTPRTPAPPPRTSPHGPSHPTVRATGAPGQSRRHTVLVTIIVILVVAAVLAAAYLVRQQVRHTDAHPGYVPFERDGYQVSLPKGWTWANSVNGTTQIQSPDKKSFLQVDTTSWPMEAATPRAQADRSDAGAPKPGSRLPGYSRINVSSATYQGAPAADWEFTFNRDGSPIHVVDRFVRLKGRPFAIYFRTPQENWEATAKVRSTIFDTFRVA
ncbi:serine/threonine-protein kinase [Actinomadura rupiterrae]|uniref:serine/threonine-protein kinase n=1 Tax=Actinomadura rupiterrae TaxID=559627 RepID=UPI0020A38C6E|nr:serine/threonine-protein kinase [Actinomadura rupiterrae]MCP2335077.1 serine/threonine protein kinase [Actinomadura rupiterrae]